MVHCYHKELYHTAIAEVNVSRQVCAETLQEISITEMQQRIARRLKQISKISIYTYTHTSYTMEQFFSLSNVRSFPSPLTDPIFHTWIEQGVVRAAQFISS